MIKNEKQLIQACLDGNPKAQRQLYQHFSGKMMGICMRYASDRPEAEDMLQDGFCRVFTDLSKFRAEGPLGAWIRRVVINTALQHLRRKKTRMFPTIELQEIKETHLSAEDIISQFSAQDLLQIIQQLPPGYRMVFNLHAIEGYSHEEIADQLGISIGTSKSQLSKARATIKKMLTSETKQQYERKLYQ